MSKKQKKRHTESSQSRNKRKEHDRKAREHNEDVYGNEGTSNTVRYAAIGITAVVALTLIVLFMSGLFEW